MEIMKLCSVIFFFFLFTVFVFHAILKKRTHAVVYTFKVFSES